MLCMIGTHALNLLAILNSVTFKKFCQITKINNYYITSFPLYGNIPAKHNGTEAYSKQTVTHIAPYIVECTDARWSEVGTHEVIVAKVLVTTSVKQLHVKLNHDMHALSNTKLIQTMYGFQMSL